MDRLQDDVGFLLSRASGLGVRAANAALAPHGLRVRQYSVLRLAGEAPDGLSQRELAAVLGLDPSQVVLLVDELAAAGLVERRPSPADRRTKLVAATSAGRRLRDEAAPLVSGALDLQLSGLSPTERDQLRELLGRVSPPVDQPVSASVTKPSSMTATQRGNVSKAAARSGEAL